MLGRISTRHPFVWNIKRAVAYTATPYMLRAMTKYTMMSIIPNEIFDPLATAHLGK